MVLSEWGPSMKVDVVLKMLGLKGEATTKNKMTTRGQRKHQHTRVQARGGVGQLM